MNTKVKSSPAPKTPAPVSAPVPTHVSLDSCKIFNGEFRTAAKSFPEFPSVGIVIGDSEWNLTGQTVGRVFGVGVERLVSATTAGNVSDKTIREVLDLLSNGYLSVSEKSKAEKSVTATTATGKKTAYHPQAEIVSALRSLGYDKAAATVAAMDAEKYLVVYAAQLANDGSKLSQAHAYVNKALADAAARKAEQALAGIDLSEL